jgi:hypothetical protein
MSTITRKEFAKELSQGTINVNDMAPENKEKLNKAGITDKQLAKIAGKDGQIHGEKEFKKLFKAVDKFDKNHSNSSIATERKDGTPTKSGIIHEGLKSEVNRNRDKASRQGVIHLGMREESSKEAEALEKGNKKAQGGVHRIEGFKSEGKITYNGKKLDLKTREEGLAQFQDALTSGPDKMLKDQAKKFVDFLATQKNESRDELAQLGLKFHQTGEGKLPVNRLVISGHGFDGEISGEGEGSFKLTDVEALAKVFPKGAAKIEHVAVSACFCASKEHFDTLRSHISEFEKCICIQCLFTQSGKRSTEASEEMGIINRWE